MKVLHIVPSYKPAYLYGGTITAVAILCESQAQLADEIHVLTTTANGKNELETGTREIEGVQVTYCRRITKDHTHFSPQLLRTLRRTIHEYDAVHLHSWWNLVTIPALLICKLKGVRPFFSPHGMLSYYSLHNESGKAKLVFHNAVGKTLLRSSILHATAPQEAAEGKQLIDDWQSVVVPNIVELPKRLNYRTRENKGILEIAFLSRIHHKKGIEFLLRALSETTVLYRLRIAGGGEETYIEQLKKLAKELNIANKVDWVGWLDGKAKYEFLANADVLALTSYNENFAMVVIESLAVGTPVFLSDRVGLSEYVEDNKLGWVTELDEVQITQQIEYIFNHQAESKAIRTRAADQIYEDFAALNLAKQYLKAYQEKT